MVSRMFTSRAEYRLLLRNDNADTRLMEKGYRIGLLPHSEFKAFLARQQQIRDERRRLKTLRVKTDFLKKMDPALDNGSPVGPDQTLEQLLKRPEMNSDRLYSLFGNGEALSDEIKKRVEIEVKYEGYIQRQMKDVERFKKMEGRRIAEDFEYRVIKGLSNEVLEKLEAIRPLSIGQASRISGVTPAAISLLLVALGRGRPDRLERRNARCQSA